MQQKSAGSSIEPQSSMNKDGTHEKADVFMSGNPTSSVGAPRRAGLRVSNTHSGQGVARAAIEIDCNGAVSSGITATDGSYRDWRLSESSIFGIRRTIRTQNRSEGFRPSE